MRLVNQTKNTVLAEDIFIAKSTWSRMKGLLGRKALLPGQAIILDPCNSVHTFFMRFPIDVLFLDKDYKVIRAIPKLVPNRITSIYWYSRCVVELPSGKLTSADTQATDQLKLLE